MIDSDSVRAGTIGYTFGIHQGEEVRVRVTARGMVGDSDVITYATIGRTGGAGSRYDAWICTASGREWSWRRNGLRRIRRLFVRPGALERWLRRYPS